MKKIILSALVLSMAVAVQAQDIPERKSERPGMMERKKHHQGMEFKALNLTEEQKAKFKTQNETFRKQMEDLKKKDDITVREWKAKAENLRKEHKQNLQNILTTEQKEKMKTAREEGMKKHADIRKKMGDRMKTELGLTADQSAKLESNHKALAEKMKAIRENSSLSDEQKREQVKQLHLKQKEELKKILTEEQIQKMKEKRPMENRKRPAVKEKTI